MLKKWTGDLVGKMHNHQITAEELGNELGFCKGYVSQILNCKRNPPDIKTKMQKAVDAIIERRKQKTQGE